MTRRRDAMGWTRAETDVAEVMIWLRSNHGREVSYADIAAGVGIKDGARLRRAAKVARVVAANRGDRLERFLPSQPRPAPGLRHPLHATRPGR
ncbi:hypothetical protein ACIBHY_52475 [Nonomuraea sp. NPDC050547]|uniref:hypothetical protein n=1 Tax=Nonomuraea sp. NPDC050547 TaxID=3364368 RepID=UPI0037B84142